MTLAALILARAASGLPALVLPGPGEPAVIPWRDLAREAGSAALALLAGGLEAREAVGFLAASPGPAQAAVFGTWLAGGIVTFLDPALPADALGALLQHAECRTVFAGSACPLFEDGAFDVVALPGVSLRPPARGWGDFLASANLRAQTWRRVAERRVSELTPGDVACYAYGAGPHLHDVALDEALLAAKLTHGGLLAAAEGLKAALGLAQGDRVVSLLALHHAAARALEVAVCLAEAALCEAGSPLAPDPDAWWQTSPTVLAAPYQATEALARRLLHDGNPDRPGLRGRAWRWALSAGQEEFRRLGAPLSAGGARGWRLLLARRLGLDAARQRLGGALRLVLACGGTPSALARDVLGALGTWTAPCYALTEASGLAALADPRTPGPPGTVGFPLAGAELQVAHDGEILMRGASLFAGYLKDPGATDQALIGGWFRTGDRGEWTDDGQLRLLGPQGDERGLVVRVTAFEVEVALRREADVGDAVAVPGSPWTALVVPAAALVDGFARRSGIPAAEALTDPRVEAAVARAVLAYNAGAEHEARVSAFALVPELPCQPLGTPDRKAAASRYAHLLDSPVPAPPGDFL